MFHFEKKISEIFSPEGPYEHVCEPARMFPQASLWLSIGLTQCHRQHEQMLQIWLLYDFYFVVCAYIVSKLYVDTGSLHF